MAQVGEKKVGIRRERWFFGLMLLAALLYLPTVWFGFAYDDILQITLNPQVNGGAKAGVGAVFFEPTPPGNLYRPLATASYRVTYLMGGGAPWIFHLVNIMLYALCAVLVLVLYRRYLGEKAALVGGVLFVVHPIHVEVVANAIGRAELLAAVFGLGGFLLVSESRGFGRAGIGAVLIVLGALGKESALAVYPLALGARWWGVQRDRRFGANAGVTGVCAALILGYLALRSNALDGAIVPHVDGVAWVENPVFHLGFLERLVPCLKILGDYLALLIAPLRLSADYSSVVSEFFAEVYSPVGALRVALFGSFLGLLWFFRRESWAFLGVWFLGAFLLTANIVLPIGTIMGERLAFLPSVGFIGWMVGVGGKLLGRTSPALLRFAVVLIVVCFATRTAARIPVWRSNEMLLLHTVLDRPQSPKALYNYGVDLFVRKGDLGEAERVFEAVLQVVPDHLLSLQALADIALKHGDRRKLERWYRRILEVKPGEPLVTEQLQKLLEMGGATTIPPDE